MSIHSNELINDKKEISTITEQLLLDVRTEEIPKDRSIAVPIAQLSTLGAAVSTLIPALNTITNTTTMDMSGLYRLANKSVGDTLKAAQNGNFWGALKTAEGKSKFAQLSNADPISTTNTIVMNANPAMIMMSIALFSIEKELGNIADMEKQILSFLQIEKESEIEADVVTLNTIISKYKYNWDNEHYIASNHKMVLDIQRTARKNMISFQKKVAETLNSKKFVIAQGQVSNALRDLLKKFKYYRLSLYTFSLASLVEIMLSGNFKEENIEASISEVRKNTDEYRELFSDCSVFLEKLSKGSLESNVLKGLGAASDVMGKFIGSIPKIKEGQVDEFLQEAGGKLKTNALGISNEVIESFSEVSNPNTGVFMQKMEDMIQIYDKTTEICFDKENIYLIAG
ncbi:hypothetical protein SAMN04487829_0026 [Pseudobutyrivibrio sp. NOR37]|uniref:Uncharacterized protein n=1 Tax=Pseudobutyrivibrio xylanivorans TaxID=185007 RepID=A0A6M0LF73_PSEXY|nr:MULTISPECIES: hypothetical protein [Pseudobutyrivibrio]NEX00459.1 hypothetical protein [Pseudobutyrivibrio xylanivorans]SFR59830.1 hypothetical protein SAMN04487829_0026 [Pseudobutyrivibrio sp. NOR37]